MCTCSRFHFTISLFPNFKTSQETIAERIKALQYTSSSNKKPSSSSKLAPDKETLQRKARKHTPREQRFKTTVVDTRPTEENTTSIENEIEDLSVEQLESLIAELDDEEVEKPIVVQKANSVDGESSTTSEFCCANEKLKCFFVCRSSKL